MLPARRLLLAAVCLCLALPFVRGAAPLFGKNASHVQTSLVAADDSVQPGHQIVVALRLVHDPHWHTYWVNPGTGLATKLEWKLPPGWQATDILWPAPHILRDHTGAIIGQGYDGDILLPVVITAPADAAPGAKVTLTGSAEWLMCQDVCVPGNADVSATITITAEPPQPNQAWGAKLRAAMAALPRTDPQWQVTATRESKTVTLRVTPGTGPKHAPADLHFFSSDGLIAYDQPQIVTADGKGGSVLTLPVSPEGPANATRLVGVLTAENGWLADGSLRGLKIDAKLEPAVAGASTPGQPKTAAAPAQPLAATLLVAFIGGLILNLMPCVFPVLGIKILGFVNQAGHQRSRVVAHGLTFALGVLLSFWTLAGVLAVLRAGGAELGWGFQLQSPAFVYALAVLMLVFGLNMSGVFEFGLRATAVGSELQSKTGYLGSFFSGVLATVVATPCSAPFLAPALGAALAVPPVQSFAIFTTIALGLSLPYLLLSIFPQAIKLLPRPGAWMETFKQLMAFPLFGTVAYLIWVLAAQLSEEGFRSALFSFVAIALAVWLYGRWSAPGAKPGRVRLAVVALVAVGAAGLVYGWPRTPPAPSPETAGAPAVVWEPWTDATVAKLRSEGRTIYVDFTARWCFTCQTNKELVFHNDEVLRYFAAHKIATLRADWTNRDPRITAELARYNRSAVPFDLIWLPGRDEPLILPEVLTAGRVLDALQHAGPASAAGKITQE
jgi:thiol:disulfide interchange protein/DsbC/DsbD-like thiol-disulfide interchange protein